jgi:hypothetical protein
VQQGTVNTISCTDYFASDVVFTFYEEKHINAVLSCLFRYIEDAECNIRNLLKLILFSMFLFCHRNFYIFFSFCSYVNALQVAEEGMKFDPYVNDVWATRNAALDRFIQAARKVGVHVCV